MNNPRANFMNVAVLVAAFVSVPSVAATKCETLEGAVAGKLVEYLQGDRDKLSDACIQFAIEELGQQRYIPAASTIVRYLDFKLPEPPPKPGPPSNGAKPRPPNKPNGNTFTCRKACSSASRERTFPSWYACAPPRSMT